MFRRLAPICAAALVLAACGGTDDAAGDTSPVPVATAAPAATPAPAATQAPGATQAPAESAAGGTPDADVPEALKFSAPLVGGGEIEMGNLAGRPVLLWFWAPW